MRQAAQELVAPTFDDDRLCDHRAELGHTLPEPGGDPSAVERQVRAARTPAHDATAWRAGSNSGRTCPSSAARSKLGTVTPTSRTPFGVGRTDQTSAKLASRSAACAATGAGWVRLRRQRLGSVDKVLPKPGQRALGHGREVREHGPGDPRIMTRLRF